MTKITLDEVNRVTPEFAEALNDNTFMSEPIPVGEIVFGTEPIARDYKKDFEMYRSYVGSCITNKTSSIDTFTEFANPEIE